MSADLIEIVSEAVGIFAVGGVEEQPGRFDRAGGADDCTGRGRLEIVADEERDRSGGAEIVGVNPLRHGAGDESTPAGGEGAGDHRVLRAIFSIGRAGEADAHSASAAGVPAVVGDGVDEKRRGERA